MLLLSKFPFALAYCWAATHLFFLIKSKPCPFWGESFAKAQGGLLGRVLCKSKGKAKVKSPLERQRLEMNGYEELVYKS